MTSRSLVLALASVFLRHMWRLLSVLFTIFRDGEVTSSSLVLALVSVFLRYMWRLLSVLVTVLFSGMEK